MTCPGCPTLIPFQLLKELRESEEKLRVTMDASTENLSELLDAREELTK